jgi:hypothetical protein
MPSIRCFLVVISLLLSSFGTFFGLQSRIDGRSARFHAHCGLSKQDFEKEAKEVATKFNLDENDSLVPILVAQGIEDRAVSRLALELELEKAASKLELTKEKAASKHKLELTLEKAASKHEKAASKHKLELTLTKAELSFEFKATTAYYMKLISNFTIREMFEKLFLRVVDLYNQGVAGTTNIVYDAIIALPSNCDEKKKFLETARGPYPKKLIVNILLEKQTSVQVAVTQFFNFPSGSRWPIIPDEFLYSQLSDYVHEFPFKTVLASNKYDINFKKFLCHLAKAFDRPYVEFEEELTASGEEFVDETIKAKSKNFIVY